MGFSPSLSLSLKINKPKKKKEGWGAWVAQLVKHLPSAQVMISQFVGLSPASGSVLTAQSLEPASDSVSPSLSLCSSPAHALSLSLSPPEINENIKKKIFFKK